MPGAGGAAAGSSARRVVRPLLVGLALLFVAPSALLLAVGAANVWLSVPATRAAGRQAAGAPPKNARGDARVAAAYLDQSIGFEPNVGQTDPRVDFLARGGGYTAFLTPTGATLVGRRRPGSPAAAVRMEVIGANPAARATGHRRLAARAHYLLGSDPARWKVDVPVYARVDYRDVYPGVDLVYHGTRRQVLEYDFVVAPGTAPEVIRLAFRGAKRPRLDAAGDLILETAAGHLKLVKPVVYQESAGRRRAVTGGFALTTRGEVAFAIGSYDRTQPLVIDPVITYATYLGGTSNDEGFAVVVDATGHAYVTGDTVSTDFPATTGALQGALAGGFDVFVTKLDASGSGLVYSTYLGGTGNDGGRAITIDAVGNAYVAGFTESLDFPATAGALQGTFGGGARDAFLAKLNPAGSQLVYATFLGGTDSDVALGVAVDALGAAHVVGGTFSADFPLAIPAQPATGGGRDGFASKINAQGSAFVYSTYVGGAGDDVVNAVTVDSGAFVYLAGVTASADFPVFPGGFQTTFGGGATDAFVTKLDASNGVPVYSTYLGGSGNDEATGLAIDPPGNAYIAGNSASGDFPLTSGGLSASSFGFVTKLAPGGGVLVFSRAPALVAVASGIGVDVTGRPHVVGSRGACTTTVPPFACVGPQTDAVVARLSSAGTRETYTQIVGGSGFESGEAIALDPVANAYVTGRTDSADFPATTGAFQMTGTGASAFVAKVTDTVGVDQTPPSEDGDASGGFCVVSSAAVGSSTRMAGADVLRRFRDRVLLARAPGRALVRLYYDVSPPLAQVVAANAAVRWTLWLLLVPVVATAALALVSPGLALAAGSVIVGAMVVVGAIVLVAGTARQRLVALGLLVAGAVAVLLPVSPVPRRALAPERAAAPADPRASIVAAPRAAPERARPAGPSYVGPPSIGDGLAVRRADVQDLRRVLPESRLSIVPIPGRGLWINGPVVDAVLDGDGLSVSEPRALAAFGIEPGDRVRALNGWPVTGILVVLQRLARDPDAALVQVELERRRLRMVQPLRVR